MATTVGTESTLTELLSNLVELDFDAIEAYRAAIDRLEDAWARTRMGEFMADHERHTRELGGLLADMGEEAPTSGSMKSILTKGKVQIANLGGDKPVLQAMLSNEQDTNTAYERAVEHDGLSTTAREVLRRGLADERRHRAWIEGAIARMG